jgi:nifR3 family TIM-barrel protein
MSFWPEIAEPIIGLSPMDGVTDASFRYMAAKHGGPDVTFTEFVNIQSALYSPQTLLRDFGYSELERPIVAQVYGKTPELFYKVAHVVCELGFDGLDINMGCPAKKVAASGCGAALIRTPDLAREIIRAAQRGIKDWQGGQTLSALGFGQDLIEQIDATKRQRSRTPPLERRLIPLSVKTRLGYDRDVVETWLSTLLSERPAAISLHGRTLQQGYKGEADWQAIGRAVRGAEGSNAKIIGNGDVHTLQEAYRRVRETGVDGVLIGRGAQGDPWLFREKEALKRALRDGGEVVSAAAPVALTERFRVMIEHSEHFERLNGAARFVAMRKHLTWYCRNFRGAAEMRARMTRAESAADVRRCAAEFMPSALDGLTGMIHWHAKHPDLPELPADVADSSCA